MKQNKCLDAKMDHDNLILDFWGHLNSETSEYVANEMEKYYEKKLCNTIINLKDINFIGSEGFKVLLNTHRRLENKGLSLTLHNLPFKTMAVFRSLGFDMVFNIQ